jgi:hypothetical protein
MRTKICPIQSANKYLGSLADKNQKRVKSFIYQKIEQVTLYKTYYTSIRPNSAGARYYEKKFV